MTFNEQIRTARIGRNLILATMAMMIAAIPAFAVGTVTQAVSPIGRDPGSNPDTRLHAVTINWTADAANGTVPATAINLGSFPAIQGMRLVSFEAKPGSPAPTNNYTITLTDTAGVDLLAGAGATLSNVNSASLSVPSLQAPIFGGLTFTLTGNAVNSATGSVYVYFAPIAAALTAPGAAGLSTSQTFSGSNTLLGGSNTVAAYNVNNIKYIDGCISGVTSPKYACTGAGLASANTDLLALGGGTIVVPSGGIVNITSAPLLIGNIGPATQVKPVKLIIEPSAQLSCNFSSSTTPCIEVGDSSAIDGVSVLIADNSNQVPHIRAAANSLMASLVAAQSPNGSQERFDITNISLGGDTSTSDIRVAALDLSGVGDITYAEHNIISNYRSTTAAPGILIGPGVSPNPGTGQYHITANWVNSGVAAPCYTITNTNGSFQTFIANIYMKENECQNAGTASMITITSGTVGQVRQVYIKGFFGGSSTNTKLIDVNGCYGCRFEDLQLAAGAASTTAVFFEATANANAMNVVENVYLVGGNWLNAIFDATNSYASGQGSSQMFSYYQEGPSNSPRDYVSWRMVEQGNAFDAKAGLDACIGNSTAHAIQCSYNNGSFFNVPLVGIANTWSANQSFNSGTLLPSAAGGTDLGSTALPFGNLWLGTAATNNFKFAPASTTAARVISIPDPGVNTNLALNLTATSSAFATATTAGTCVQQVTAVAGAATTMVATASPVSTPGVGAVWSAFVSSAGNVTINECAVATSAGGTIAFNIRVTP